MVGTGILPNNMRSPSPEFTRHSGWWPHTVTPSIDRTLHQFLTITDLDLITEFDFLPNCTRFPIEHMQRVRHANRERLLLRTPGPVPFGICKCSLVETTNTQSYITPVYDTFPWFDFLPTLTLLLNMFPKGICNGCGMPTGDAYSSGHLVLSHFGTCMCSNVETNLSWTCLVSGLLNFEHPSVLLFCFIKNGGLVTR